MNQSRREAPAKINLALDILGSRADGYHEMRMVMQTVSLTDTVTLASRRAGFVLHTDGDFLPPGKKTLEQQAAESFFAAIGQPVPGLQVTLEKRIPAYAGLGGGSADVAALLRLLRERYAPALSNEDLERIGLQVGSDMPFCVRGGTALARGRGEHLTDLSPLPDCPIVLCKPPFGIPTPILFSKADSVNLQCHPDIEGMIAALEQHDLPGVAARLCNVFEEVLPEEYGEVFSIKRRLLELGASNAAMSGSGPTVFAIFSSRTAAEQAVSVLQQTYPETFLTKPVQKISEPA